MPKALSSIFDLFGSMQNCEDIFLYFRQQDVIMPAMNCCNPFLQGLVISWSKGADLINQVENAISWLGHEVNNVLIIPELYFGNILS